MSRSVPERWLPYKAYGDVIKGTKIVAFKVPLKETVANNLQPDQRFTPKILLEALPRIKYVIDLTDTHRYYDPKEFIDAGLKHLKIMVPGRLVPPQESVKRFFKAMDDFTATSETDELIGVHCTHGVNRTGYFICRYLIQQLGWESQEAIAAFEEARGYPMERDVYLNDLKTTPKGEKLDTREITLESPIRPIRGHKRVSKRPGPLGPMGPPGFRPSRRGFPNGRPYPPPHDRFGYGPPAFNPQMPLRPPMPPMPPPHGAPYGPRPLRYGPPPGRGFPNHGFPPRMPPGLPRMPMPGGPPRLPGPPGPLGPPGAMGPPRPLGPICPMGPPCPGPRLPPHGPPQPMPPMLKGPAGMIHPQKKKMIRNGGGVVRNTQISRRKIKPLDQTPRNIPSRINNREQDFTADTFEENLITSNHAVTSSAPIPVPLMITGPRRRNKGRFNNRLSRGK